MGGQLIFNKIDGGKKTISSYATMVMMETESSKGEKVLSKRGEEEFPVAENGESSRSEREDNSVTVQNQNNELVNWEIEEVNPIVIHQQQTIQEIEKDTSTWVKQNLIKLGKIFGVEFQGHEEEATELLLQIHSYRLARRMEQELAG
ncbi:hypothetical protein KY284_015948 [Solanum tuberosum]|nr:hypothetical protein KY284_015948 [Solanum tuberosum]